MPLAILGFILASTSPLAASSDVELCSMFQTKAEQMKGFSISPATMIDSWANCTTKRWGTSYVVDLDQTEIDAYIQRYMGGADQMVCKSTDPTLVTFRERGWQFEYYFESNDGKSFYRLLEC